MASDASSSPGGPDSAAPGDWRLLLGLNLYRLLLVTLLQVIQQLGLVEAIFEGSKPQLFYNACLAYGLAALLALMPAISHRPGIRWQALGNLLLDTVAVIFLMRATGGVPGGMGMLLVPSVMAISLLLSSRQAFAAAALATIAMFVEEALRHSPFFFGSSDYTGTGLLGLLFFAVAIGANAVAQRAWQSEALAQRVGSEFEDLAQLNETVLDTMLTGVAVLDTDNRIRTINQAGADLLHIRVPIAGQPLAQFSLPLHEALQRWRAGSAALEGPIAASVDGGAELLPRFRRLNSSATAPVLVLLEDAARVREQAQQIKLAALGRLSASIAHEIRNPLTAIHHAAQLLEETMQGGEPNAEADAKLVSIIQRQSRRIDVIVRDVLNLSKGAADPRVIELANWAARAIVSYQEAHPDRRPLVQVAPGILCRFDPNHLQQVLFNLIDNAYLHGRTGEAQASVRVLARKLYAQGGALEVEDQGPGVAPAVAANLFEPFFTTTSSGTGLGLYLARELCAYNQAKLTLHPRDGGGAVFRITFVAPETTDSV